MVERVLSPMQSLYRQFLCRDTSNILTSKELCLESNCIIKSCSGSAGVFRFLRFVFSAVCMVELLGN